MTDIYGYATAAPLYRAAGWMQVIPLPEGRKTPPPSHFTEHHSGLFDSWRIGHSTGKGA